MPEVRAIDSARLRCAALADAKAAVFAPPRRDAVAPVNEGLASTFHRGRDFLRDEQGAE